MSDNPIVELIKSDIEHFKKTVNEPEPPKVYDYGDGSGERMRIFEVVDDRCPLCGEEHDQSFTFNGVVMVACPEMPEGWQLPLRRVTQPGPFTLTPPARIHTTEE